MAIEKHYSRPMDIESAKQGITGELFIIQARPETEHANKDVSKQLAYTLTEPGEVLVQGRSTGATIGAGAARTILDASHMKELRPREVLVTDITDPDWELPSDFDERNEAIAILMQMAIEACSERGKYIGICGQAPSDFPEITQWLEEKGIQSIALNPDSILKMTHLVLDVEKKQPGA